MAGIDNPQQPAPIYQGEEIVVAEELVVAEEHRLRNGFIMMGLFMLPVVIASLADNIDRILNTTVKTMTAVGPMILNSSQAAGNLLEPMMAGVRDGLMRFMRGMPLPGTGELIHTVVTFGDGFTLTFAHTIAETMDLAVTGGTALIGAIGNTTNEAARITVQAVLQVPTPRVFEWMLPETLELSHTMSSTILDRALLAAGREMAAQYVHRMLTVAAHAAQQQVTSTATAAVNGVVGMGVDTTANLALQVGEIGVTTAYDRLYGQCRNACLRLHAALEQRDRLAPVMNI